MAERSERYRLYGLFVGAFRIKFLVDPVAGLEGWEIDKLMSEEINESELKRQSETAKIYQAALHSYRQNPTISKARELNKTAISAWLRDHGGKPNR